MRVAFRLAWSRVAEHGTRAVLRTLGRVPRPSWDWERLAGPLFGNAIAGLTLDGRQAALHIYRPRASAAGLALEPALELDLTS